MCALSGAWEPLLAKSSGDKRDATGVSGCFPQLQHDFSWCRQWWMLPVCLCSCFGCCSSLTNKQHSRREASAQQHPRDLPRSLMWWGRWQESERDSGRRREVQHDTGIWPRGAGRNLCREEQWVFVTSHIFDLNLSTLPRNTHRNGAWAAEVGSPGNRRGLWAYKSSPGKGELRKSHSDSYLPVCFFFPCDFWTCFKCILTVKWRA